MMLYDLVIIGGGPAGITAGIYGARKKLRTLLIAKDFFGQVAKTGRIDNWLGEFGIHGMSLMKKFEDHLKKFDIEIQEGEEVVKVNPVRKGGALGPALSENKEAGLYSSSSQWAGLSNGVKKSEKDNQPGSNVFLVATESKKEFLTKAVIVATGRNPKMLEIPGEKDFIGKGVSFCAVCDSPFFKYKRVAVIGGGNAGLEAALDLVEYAKEVFIFERENALKADEILIEQAKKTGKIQIHLNKELKKIEGNNKVEDIIYQDLVTRKTFQLPIEGVFVLVGSIPASAFLKGLVVLNENQEIKVKSETCQTSMPGIFASGDVNDSRCKQIVIAAADGAKAALAVYEYLQNIKY